MNPRLVAVLSFAVALLPGCAQSDTERYKAELIAADKAFSASSAKEGAKAAFLRSIARDAKLLSIDNRYGADAVNSLLGRFPPTATLTWEPAFVDVSASGNLGYTWGRYELNLSPPRVGAAPLITRGTYVTIWKRQPGGAWKVVLDGGNPDAVH